MKFQPVPFFLGVLTGAAFVALGYFVRMVTSW